MSSLELSDSIFEHHSRGKNRAQKKETKIDSVNVRVKTKDRSHWAREKESKICSMHKLHGIIIEKNTIGEEIYQGKIGVGKKYPLFSSRAKPPFCIICTFTLQAFYLNWTPP